MEKSQVDILTEFAKRKNYQYWTEKYYKKFNLTRFDSFANIMFFTMKYESKNKPYYYYAYYSFGGDNTFSDNLFSGIYRDFSSIELPDVNIQKKFWTDSLSFRKKIKTGIPEVDKNLIIKCSDEEFPKKLINSKVGIAFNNLNKIISPIELVLQKNNLKYNPELNSKTIIGIKTNRWIVEDDELLLLLKKGTSLLDLIKDKNY